MKRLLFKQMKNEWRDNVWLVIELSVVFLAIWIIGATLFFYVEGLFKPRGFNPEDVYSISINGVPRTSDEYISLDDENSEISNADIAALLSRLRDNKNVEAVAQHWNGIPYNYSFIGRTLYRYDELDTLGYYGNTRFVSPDFITVMDITSKTGATRDQLIEMLKKGDILISDDNEEYTGSGLNPYDLKGKKMIVNGDSAKVYRVGDIIQKVRRDDYELTFGGSIILPLEEPAWEYIAVRVKPGKGKAFEEDFKNDVSMRRLRNIYLADLVNMKDMREGGQRAKESDIRIKEVIIAFLLMTIFLGLLGTFWFRLQQRISEIAIRKVVGARKEQIFRRILSEGMILLLSATLIVSVIVWPLLFADIDIPGLGIEKYILLIIQVITVLLLSAGVTISLWWPAKKAMLIEPAIAIKAE